MSLPFFLLEDSVNKFLLIAILILSGLAFAEDENVGREITGSMTLGEQEIAFFGKANVGFVSTEFVLAEEIFVGPNIVDVEIREGHQVASLYITVASKVNARVRFVLSNSADVVTNERLDDYPLFGGTQQTVNFVAFAPHSGTITILNENDDVLAVVPYTVRHENQLRHSVNGSLNTSGSASVSYSLSSSQGWSMGAGVQFDFEGNISGSISGSYSW